jgi:hypothetical protein
LNTGGATSAIAAANFNNASDAPLGAVTYFSTPPSGLGTVGGGKLGGAIDGGRLILTGGAGNNLDRHVGQYSWLNDEGPALNGATECLAWNFGGSVPAGTTMDFSCRWTEEAAPAF